MLCFITSDVLIENKALQTALGEAVAQSFNRITVDGDMSTNDTVLVLANGLAKNACIRFYREWRGGDFSAGAETTFVLSWQR